VLAHRLAEEKKSILVIEAGSDPNGVQSIDIPLMADSVRGTEFDWQYHTVPQKSACLGHINRVHLPFCISLLITHATLYQHGIWCHCHRVSVCPSVPQSVSLKPYCIKTANPKVSKTTPHDSRGTLVLWCKRSLRNSDGIIPYGGAKCRWGRLQFTFSICREVSRSDALPPKMCVHPPRWSASTMVRWRRNTWCHQKLWCMVVEVC